MPDTSLILDRRNEPGIGAGLHAILIGVSDYQFLPDADDPPGDKLKALKKLQSSSLSAYCMAEKLKSLDVEGRLVRKLKTLRLLIAPSPAEITAEPALATLNATIPNAKAVKLALRAWRQDVSVSREEQALFLFSGHGIRRSLEESMLLCADFLDPDEVSLENAFRLSSVRNGMVPSEDYPEIGREQFYFVDACRDKPDALDALEDTETPKVFQAVLNSYDDRKAPIYFATKTGGSAAGVAGKPTYFVDALLWALDHGSFNETMIPEIGNTGWPVTAQSLKVGIECANKLFENRIELTGLVADPTLCFRRDPPSFSFRLSLGPPEMRQSVKHTLLYDVNADIEKDITGDPAVDPWTNDIAAGYYRLTVKPGADEFTMVKSKVVFLTIQTKMPWVESLGVRT